MANMIRNISQTAQERTVVKTAPDIVVYLDGLPYLINYFLNDPTTNVNFVNVNFNDHVTGFQASYDTDLMVPSASLSLQIPNFQKYLYMQPGGNNLIQTMMQVQVYAKGYFNNTSTSTVYRRVFKGLVSHINYQDDGKMLQVSIQCFGTLYMLEKMQIDVNPSVQLASEWASTTGARLTVWQTNFAYHNPYRILADMFTIGLSSDAFQLNNLLQNAVLNGQFGAMIKRGYIAKWQSILTNLLKDVHIYGADWKDNLGDDPVAEQSDVEDVQHRNLYAEAVNRHSNVNEVDDATAMFYTNIQAFQPFKIITEAHLYDPVIRNRLDIIREIVQAIDFEAYQDLDGKIIIKPPLYNLDVTNLGTRTPSTSTNTNTNAKSNTSPLKQIYQNNNPFVIYLDEILQENETEDQASIRRTRTTVTGNIMRDMQINYPEKIKPTVEFIDVAKLAKFGLREEPAYTIPWLDADDKFSLFAAAAAETARANRGYRTYTVTIPMRPELKVGFPCFFPHKDMYGYIKTISISYQVGAQATMQITCDTIRRKVLVSTAQTAVQGYNQNKSFNAFTTAPNLVLQWTKNPPAPTKTDPNQSPGFNQQVVQPLAAQLAAGTAVNAGSENITKLVGSAFTLVPPSINPDGTKGGPSPHQILVHTYDAEVIGSTLSNQTDANDSNGTATYIVKNDAQTAQGTRRPPTQTSTNSQGQLVPGFNSPGGGFFTNKRPADLAYMQDLMGNPITGTPSTIPYTDDKGYEVVAPFPWGRWQSLNDAIKEITEQGWATGTTAPQDLDEVATLEATDAFMFAGLGTPTAQDDPSSKLATAQATLQQIVGGSFSTTGPTTDSGGDTTTTALQPDATIIVLDYSQMTGAFSDNSLLQNPQPEDNIAQNLITDTQSQEQQLVNVLVTGQVSSTKTTQEQLLALKTKNPPITVASIPAQAPGND